jgi:acetyl-CoA carboxylase carboxyl transferase subunit beta
VPVIVIGHDRPAGVRGARLDAAGYRKARLGMELAQELALPLVTVIDTAGAKLTAHAEEGGLAREIARCLATMTGLAAPTLSLLLGEGSGGGALALLPADRVIAAQHAWLAPISPEGASAILYRSPDHAPELATAQAM